MHMLRILCKTQRKKQEKNNPPILNSCNVSISSHHLYPATMAAYPMLVVVAVRAFICDSHWFLATIIMRRNLYSSIWSGAQIISFDRPLQTENDSVFDMLMQVYTIQTLFAPFAQYASESNFYWWIWWSVVQVKRDAHTKRDGWPIKVPNIRPKCTCFTHTLPTIYGTTNTFR